MSDWFRETPESMAMLVGERAKLDATETIYEVDQMLFDAGVLVLASKNGRDRKGADRKIMDARVKLEQLRSRLAK